MKKPYCVEVVIRIPVPVVASNPEEAERIACENVEEELNNFGGASEFVVDAFPLEPRWEDLDAIPYGPENNDPERNWTIRQWQENA